MIWVAIFLYILFFSCITFLKYQSFGYGDFDLAHHAQSMWNIIHGSIHCSILGIDFLGNHAHFILFLAAPIYFVFRHPITLLFLQTFSLAIAAYPIYLIAKDEINNTAGLAITLVYLFYPALWYVNLFEFHPTVFATPFLAFMFYYFRKQNFKRFVLFIILSLLCQENIPLIIVPFGIYALFACLVRDKVTIGAKRDLKWGLTPILLGSVWFLAIVGWVLPHFNQDTIQFFSLYSHMGNSIPEIAKFVIIHPFEVIKIIFTRQKIIYLAHLFMPLSFFPLFDARILIIFLPLFQHLLSLRPTEHTICYHYAAEMIPFIFISAIYGIKRFLKIPYIKTHLHQGVFISAIITIAIVSNISLLPHIYLMGDLKQFKKDRWDHQKEKFLTMVPGNASIVATFEFLPRLSHRKNLYSFHHISMGFHTLSKKSYRLPQTTGYALLDFNDYLTFKSFYRPGISDVNLRNFISKNNWGVLDMSGSIVLLKKNYQSKYHLYRVLDRQPKISKVSSAVVDDNLELLGYDVKDNLKSNHIKLTFYWKTLGPLKKDYGNFIDMVNKDGEVKYRFIKPICYRIFPTYVWPKGEVIKEDYNLLIPEDEVDICFVKMGVFDYKTGKISHIFSSIPDVVEDSIRINLLNLEAIQE